MRSLFNWFDGLPASGRSGLRWLILATILAGLSSLYLIYDKPGAIAAVGVGVFLLFLRCLYPKIEETSVAEKGEYVCCAPITWVNEENETFECWFHLYEYDDRREAVYVPCATQHSRDPQKLGQRHIVYNKVILPWINHVYSNDVVAEYFSQPKKPTPPTPKSSKPSDKPAEKVIALDQFRPK